MSVRHSECASVALDTQHAMRMRLSRSTTFIRTSSHKRHDFRGAGRREVAARGL